jgi:hypothetical protein
MNLLFVGCEDKQPELMHCGQRPVGGEKNGRLITSHRYNHLPLLSSDPGGVQQELAV